MSKQQSKLAHWWYEKRGKILPAITVTTLLLVLAVIGGAFYKGLHKPPVVTPPAPAPVLSERVVATTEDARFRKFENGKARYLLTAAKDTTYSDGRHELEKVTLVSYLPDGVSEETKLQAERGVYIEQQGQVECTGNVKLNNNDGAEITTQVLRYDQNTEVASTDQPMQFKRAEISGTSVGAVYYVKTKIVDFTKDVHITKVHAEKEKAGPPVEITGKHGAYDSLAGLARVDGEATITQGGQMAKADLINGILNTKTNPQKLEHAELRGHAYLKEVTPQKTSEIQSRDMDFFFDETQHLKQAVAVGGAQGRSLEKDSPREVKAERIEANYAVTPQGSALQTLTTQGRTSLKIIAPEETQKATPTAAPVVTKSSERVIEADSLVTFFQPDGKFLARAEASGNAVLVITPLQVTPESERKTLRAAKFNADFLATKNAMKTAIASGDAIAEFELMTPPPKPKPNEKAAPKPTKRTLKGQTLTANLHPETQDVTDLTAEGNVKFTEGERNGTAERGVYDALTQMVTLRGKPLLWDQNARTNADEIDAKLDTGESLARGKVRTTYYSRETTGGAAPFKKGKAPVTIASDTAVMRHRESVARYQGNARAWQEDDFIRGDNLELDKGERVLNAWGNVQSAFYSVERETEPGKKEIVPIFVTADKLTYTDSDRKAHYEGKVKVRQAADQIDAETADALLDEDKKLSQLTAAQNVILTQPQRRGTGDLLVYTAATDAAILTGKPAFLEDRERATTSKSPQLTLYLRDARMQAVDETGKKRVRTTHRIQR